MSLFGDGWNKIKDLAARVTKNPIDRAMDKLTKKVKDDIQNNISSGGSLAGKTFRRNKPLTKHLKSGDKPWIASGNTMNSVQIAKAGSNYGVGWNGETGDTARVVEYGIAILVTPRMKLWFGAQGFPLKESTSYIIIPPRPNLTALAKKYLASKELLELLGKEVGRSMNVKVG